MEVNRKDEYISNIVINDFFLNNPSYKLLKEYKGTFNLKLARNKEEIDFLALGHPLIDVVLDYCKNRSFPGTFTLLNLKKKALPKHLLSIIDSHKELYLFVFSIKFQGYIVENQITAIILGRNGREIENMGDFILDIENYDKIFQFNDENPEKVNLNQDFIENLRLKAKNLVKRKSSIWKKEIKILNDKIFNSEQIKKQKMYSHMKKVLNLKLESLKLKLERKESNRLTERQKQNISNIKDGTKKEEKLKKIEKMEEEISFIEKDIRRIEKNLDDLSFEYEDIKNDMIKSNLAKFYTNILGLAIIKSVD